MHHHHGAVGALPQTIGHALRIERAAPFDIDGVDLCAERLGDRDEAFAELAGDDDKDRISGAQDVDERRLHHRRAGAGGDQHIICRAEDRLQALLAFRQNGPELGAAVVEDRQRGGLSDAFGDGGRAGKAEAIVGNAQHDGARLAQFEEDRQLAMREASKHLRVDASNTFSRCANSRKLCCGSFL